MRIGMGYDVHRLVENRDLIIGGVNIPCEKGLLGHSDADVLVHAVMDALLGAAALGDIGQHFPDNDPAYAGADSIKLLKEVGRMLDENNYTIENIDATIIAQKPKMRPYIDQMRKNIAEALNIRPEQVSVKATTEEGLGFTGNGEGISAQAEQSCRNVGAILEAAGSGLDRVVKTTCFLTDINDFALFNEIYAELFPGKPARSCLEVSKLPKGALVEIEVVAEIA